MRPWLARRPIYGHYEQLMNELLRENHTDFKNFLCVEPEMFFELVERVGPGFRRIQGKSYTLSLYKCVLKLLLGISDRMMHYI